MTDNEASQLYTDDRDLKIVSNLPKSTHFYCHFRQCLTLKVADSMLLSKQDPMLQTSWWLNLNWSEFCSNVLTKYRLKIIRLSSQIVRGNTLEIRHFSWRCGDDCKNQKPKRRLKLKEKSNFWPLTCFLQFLSGYYNWLHFTILTIF